MNYTVQALCTNGAAAVLLVVLLLNYARKRNKKQDEFMLYAVMIFFNLMQCIIEPITVLIDGQMFFGAVTVAKLLNAWLFINTTIFAYLWSLYAGVKVRYGKKRRTVWNYLQALPALGIAVCSVINIFTPMFFEITEENLYVRVGIYPVSYIVTYFYLVLGTVLIYVHRKRVEKFTFLPVVTFLLPVCLASIIQYMLPGISLLWAGSAIGLCSAYISLLDERASTDELSGLFSRHYLNQWLATLHSRARESRYLLGIMLDVDDFKLINDRYGHLAGDGAIMAVGQILRAAITEKRTIFRYAGDEFVIIMPIDAFAEIDPILEKIQNETEKYIRKHDLPYRLHLSAGCTVYNPGEAPNAFIDRMDEQMYKNKEAYKLLRRTLGDGND